MSAMRSLVDIRTWWLETVNGMLGRASSPSAHLAPLAVTLPQHDGYEIVAELDDGRHMADKAVDETALLGAVRRLNRKVSDRSRRCTIRVPRNRYFMKQLAPLKLPPSQFEKMAVLDLVSSTPLKAHDVYLFPVETQDVGSAYGAVKKQILGPVLDVCRRGGFTVASIMLENAHDSRPGWVAHAGIAQLNNPRGFSRFMGQLSVLLVVLVVLAMLATYGHVKWRHVEAGRLLDDELQQATSRAANVRSLIAQRRVAVERIVTIRQEKTDTVPLTLIIEELSKILPDNAWLTDVELDSNNVRISGFTTSASSLVSVLEGSPYFEAPTFRNPVLRVSAEVGERFTISMNLEAPGV